MDVSLVLQLLLALLHVLVKQRCEPETFVTAVAGEACVAHHVHLQLVARLECFWARVALDPFILLVNLVHQLGRKISHSLANLFRQGCTLSEFGVHLFSDFGARQRQALCRDFQIPHFWEILNINCVSLIDEIPGENLSRL